MKEQKDQPKQNDSAGKQPLREDDGKRTPPTHPVRGGEHSATRPEQEPDIPPHERTEGIP